MTEWIKNQNTSICKLQEIQFRPKDPYSLKMKGWKKVFHANGNKKKPRQKYLSDKIDFKTRNVTRDKKGIT